MATLKDIAECVGVSISTVSRVLHGTAPISAKVKQQILAIAAE
ncbi:MAG: LacI family DNA-binding transcriptional regulator [Symbiopectobacterium sp.]